MASGWPVTLSIAGGFLKYFWCCSGPQWTTSWPVSPAPPRAATALLCRWREGQFPESLQNLQGNTMLRNVYRIFESVSPNAGISKTMSNTLTMSSWFSRSFLVGNSICRFPANVTRALIKAFSKIDVFSLKRAVNALLTAGKSTGSTTCLLVSAQESSSLSFSPSSDLTSSLFRPFISPGRIKFKNS